jgi:hypothetical protein
MKLIWSLMMASAVATPLAGAIVVRHDVADAAGRDGGATGFQRLQLSFHRGAGITAGSANF